MCLDLTHLCKRIYFNILFKPKKIQTKSLDISIFYKVTKTNKQTNLIHFLLLTPSSSSLVTSSFWLLAVVLSLLFLLHYWLTLLLVNLMVKNWIIGHLTYSSFLLTHIYFDLNVVFNILFGPLFIWRCLRQILSSCVILSLGLSVFSLSCYTYLFDPLCHLSSDRKTFAHPRTIRIIG